MPAPSTPLDEYAVARAMQRVARRNPYRTDDATASPSSLYAAVCIELGLDNEALVHPNGYLDDTAQSLLAYVQRTRSRRLLWSYRVETATRPSRWHSTAWHRRHRPWLVECS